MGFEANSPLITPVKVPNETSNTRREWVRALSRGAHVHVIGVCGTGMASVAQLLKQLGFYVSGSDKAFYPPMGEVVRKTVDVIFEGYKKENLSKTPALVVVGNTASRDNPEVQEVIEKGIPFASMPEVFSALLIGGRNECGTSVVVTGTHGKTTTTALVSSMLEDAGRSPGYFIGGAPLNFSSSIRSVDVKRPAEDRVVVLEGDEYDSAFFSKYAKFQSYRPDIAIITSLEFDHADIYSSIEAIEEEFTRFVALVPEGGVVLYCADYQRLHTLAKSWSKNQDFKATFLGYGLSDDATYRLQSVSQTESGTQKLVLSLKGKVLEVESSLCGPHNALNVLAAASVGALLGLSDSEIQSGIRSFLGVKRRQQVVFEDRGIIVIEDFAHHPTAVQVTLEGLKTKYPKKRLIAVFEPRSNTSRRQVFQDEYKKSFQSADIVVLKEIGDYQGYSATKNPVEGLNVSEIVSALEKQNKKARCFESVEEILLYLNGEVQSGDVVVVMSNGDFGGLISRYVEGLKSLK